MAIRLYIISAWFTVASQLVKGLQHYWPLPFRICVRSAHCCSVQSDRNRTGSDYSVAGHRDTCVPLDAVTPLYSAVPRALQQPAQGAAPPHGQTS